MAVLAPAVVADGPSIGTMTPSDGQVLTEAQVLVSGNCTASRHTVVLGEHELGGHGGMNTAWVNGNLTMRPRMWFSDDFSDAAGFSDRWTYERNSGVIEINGGNLVMRSTYPMPSMSPLGLLSSAHDVFPSGLDWVADLKVYHYYSDVYGSGIGITPGPITLAGSTIAEYYSNDGYYNRDKAYAQGNVVFNEYADYRSHLWTVEYSSHDQSATFLRDDVYLATFRMGGEPDRFWIGALNDHTGNYSDISVDYVQLWTYNGTWTSDPYDFGHDVRLEDVALRWTTTHPQAAQVALEVRVSNSTGEWTDWAPFARGGDLATSDVRSIQFRTGMDLRRVMSEQASLMASAVVVDYLDPVVSVEVRRAGSEWTLASGLERWSLNLPLGEDENVIEVRATDTSGANTTTDLRVVVDTTRPIGTVSISPKVSPTNDPDVTLALTANDKYGVPWMQLSSFPDMANAVTLPFNGSTMWSLDRVDGEVHVYARFIDAHGLLSDIISDSLVLDLSPPSGSVTVAGGALYCSTTIVRLDLEYYDAMGVAKVELSNRPDFWGAEEVAPPQRTVAAWDLGGSEDGPRTVHMRITDVVGNVEVADDTIEVYVPKALGAVIIEDGAAFTGTPVVSVKLEFPLTLHPSRVELANDAAFATGQEFAFVGEMLWIVPSGDGPRTVYARFEDFRGIWSLPVSSIIELDSTAPNVTVVLEGGAQYTTQRNLTATVGCQDASGPVRMWLSPDGRFDLVEPVPYTGTVRWTVAGNEADYALHVQVEDRMGNLGVGAASIHFATIVPQLTMRLPDGPFTNAESPLAVSPEVVDPYGGIELQFSLDADPGEGEAWQPFERTMGFIVAPTTLDGAHEVRARARNVAGLVSLVASVPLTVDRVAPRLSIRSPEDGAVVEQRALRVGVEFIAEDPSGIYRVSYSVDDGNWTPAVTADRVIVVDIPARGRHTVTVLVIDRAGNDATESTTFDLVEGEGRLAEGAGVLVLAIVAVAVIAVVALLALRARRRPPGAVAPPGAA